MEPDRPARTEPARRSLLQRICLGLLGLFGWRALMAPLPGPRGVIMVYPHTSNWDFILGMLYRFGTGLQANWMGKDTIFRWPFRGVLIRMGGVPISRRAPGGFIGAAIEQYQANDWLWLALAPEGTRKHANHLKSGFYRIALGPACLAGSVSSTMRRKRWGSRSSSASAATWRTILQCCGRSTPKSAAAVRTKQVRFASRKKEMGQLKPPQSVLYLLTFHLSGSYFSKSCPNPAASRGKEHSHFLYSSCGTTLSGNRTRRSLREDFPPGDSAVPTERNSCTTTQRTGRAIMNFRALHIIAFCAVFTFGLALAETTFAQLGNKPMEVVNPTGETLDVAVPDGVNVNNFPASQTVNGSVGVNNFPASQTVNGTVDVGNVVTVQPIEDVGHLGVPVVDHVKMSLSAHPTLATFGLIRFQEEGPAAGSSVPTVSAGECLVVLDIAITYESVELVGPGSIGSAPFGVARFEYGLTDGSTLLRFGQLIGTANEASIGQVDYSFGAGIVLTRSGFNEDATEFALRSVSISVGGTEVIPFVLGAHATGYRIPC
jgi:hypothetical protein